MKGHGGVFIAAGRCKKEEEVRNSTKVPDRFSAGKDVITVFSLLSLPNQGRICTSETSICSEGGTFAPALPLTASLQPPPPAAFGRIIPGDLL